MIRTWHIVISGFLQREGLPNGMVGLWSTLHAAHSSGTTRVELRSWSQNWSDLAELIFRMRLGIQKPRRRGYSHSVDVRVYGYSWGCSAAVKLARCLGQRGIGVNAMVLCDPVYKHWLWLGFWRSMIASSKIVIPRNVRIVHWLRQTNPRFGYRPGGWWWPAGHEVLAEDKKMTLIYPPVLLDCEHTYADDAEEFHGLAMKIAQEGSHEHHG